MNTHLISNDYIAENCSVVDVRFITSNVVPDSAGKNKVALPYVTSTDILHCMTEAYQSSKNRTYPFRKQMFPRDKFDDKVWDSWKNSVYGSQLQDIVQYNRIVPVDVEISMDILLAKFLDKVNEWLDLGIEYAHVDQDTKDIMVYVKEGVTSDTLKDNIQAGIIKGREIYEFPVHDELVNHSLKYLVYEIEHDDSGESIVLAIHPAKDSGLITK